MFADGFKTRYTTIPFAFSNHIPNPLPFNLFTHHHKEVEIIAMYEGEAEFFSGPVRHELKAGDVLIIPPYKVHRAIVPPNSGYGCICFDLSLLWDSELREALETGKLTAPRHLDETETGTPEVNRCAKKAIEACEAGAPGWEMEVIGHLSLMFARLKSLNFFTEAENSLGESKFEKSVMDYVKEHFAEQITSTSVANALYINNSYFCRLFKNSFGCCFSDYLTSYRIGRAKQYLNGTSTSVSEIALKTGFNSFSYFSKTFKSAVGISPTKYRSKKAKAKAARDGAKK